MNTFQLILLVLSGLIVLNYIKKKIQTRGLVNYTPQEAGEKVKSSRNVILLDVRTKAEREKQSIKGSFHIPLHELGNRVDELNKFKDKEIICYCQTGNRSVTAAVKLRKKGFNAANMKGGIVRWNGSNLRK